MNTGNNNSADETLIRNLVEDWARAVRAKDIAGAIAHHSADILMFDVPPPFESNGIEAYRETWDLFYSAQPEPIAFDILRMDVIAGTDVAFVAALMRCAETGSDGERSNLDFRLTIGLRKIDGHWTVLHEHHSVPAT
ncbi:MAG: nuclear transport factor 2 family protein [Terrimicrobiaceae bacterium]|nr:nuclear transport factor 2 family protein [Terrimicrobiaceae bacterium]